MNKPNFANLLKSTRTVLVKHSPEILTGMGIAGMVMTTVLAIKATPKALKLIEDKKKEEHMDELTPIETIKAAWKPFIPVVVTGVSSIACVIGASSVNTRRNAALATAYTLSETALKEYKDKVIETIGEKKEKIIRENIDKDHVEQMPVSNSNIIITQKGNTLCLDYHAGRWFKSSKDHIERAVNKLNAQLNRDMYVSLNEFYDELGLDHTILGDDLGWNIDNGLVELDFSSQLTEDGEPCLVMNYRVAPRRDYYRLAY